MGSSRYRHGSRAFLRERRLWLAEHPRAGRCNGFDQHRHGLYAGYCSGCHGRHLEGQALWRTADSEAARRAPALDQTGHAWLLSDRALLQKVKMGDGAMPAYRNTLDDNAINSVLAFMKSRWPIALRISQALQNPGPPVLAQVADWCFPGRCRPAH